MLVSGGGFSQPISEGLGSLLYASTVFWKVSPDFLVDFQLLESSSHILLVCEPFFHNSSALNTICLLRSNLRLVGICGNKDFVGEGPSPFITWQSSLVPPLFIYFFPLLGSRGRLAGSLDIPQISIQGRKTCVHFLWVQGKITRTLASPMFMS